MRNSLDPAHTIGDAIQLGVIETVDHTQALCTVRLGDIVTGLIPWLTAHAGEVRHWSPPSAGEQCLILSPEGDLAAGLVVTGIYSDSFPPPSISPDISLSHYPDGAMISYDHAAHTLIATLPEGGTAEIHAPGGITINANVTITGNVMVEGGIEASKDVTASGISLKTHKHSDVQAGKAQTGKPV